MTDTSGIAFAPGPPADLIPPPTPAPPAVPWYKSPRRLGVLVIAVLIAAVAVFAIRLFTGDDNGGSNGSLGTIKTPAGTLTVASVQMGDRLPPGCTGDTTGVFCLKAQPGHTILQVAFNGDSATLKALDDADVYVQSSGGAKYDVDARSWDYGAGSGKVTNYLSFGPDVGEKDFTLYVPGAEPFDLGR